MSVSEKFTKHLYEQQQTDRQTDCRRTEWLWQSLCDRCSARPIASALQLGLVSVCLTACCVPVLAAACAIHRAGWRTMRIS